jgi:dephospho-CoA kinase
VIGLTGGIGSGKSTVSRLLADVGVPIIDADIIARDVVEPGQPALAEIVRHFGLGVLRPSGELDRERLGKLVFGEQHDLARLEEILHPRIIARMNIRTRELDASYCVWAIPLLLEKNQRQQVDRVLVVDVSPEVQIARARARDGRSQNDVEAILSKQMERRERLAMADDVIDNGGDLSQLRDQVLALHGRYSKIAKNPLRQPSHW